KTALIVAFTFWVLAVLVAPRGAFIVAKLVSPTRTQQAVYMEKSALRNNLTKDKEEKLAEKMQETMAFGGRVNISLNDPETQKKLDGLRGPLEEEFRRAFQNQTDKIDRDYQREKDRQEHVGETLSRIAPTSSLSYIAINLTQTGKLKRKLYFQTGERYYNQLDASYFSGISDDRLGQFMQLVNQMDDSAEPEEILPPPTLMEPSLLDTLRRSAVDVFLLGFFAVAFTTVAFLKFFRSDI
ncbi:MAG: hypothetical protein OXI63_02650, partial [Candidatus Poribacteria bacterium]|nr:hypothetical protein [Candidatus Poribacteria bacterium]